MIYLIICTDSKSLIDYPVCAYTKEEKAVHKLIELEAAANNAGTGDTFYYTSLPLNGK
jgi:hypothetical protein